MRRLLLCAVLIAVLTTAIAASALFGEAKYAVIVVVDGMRPDYMTIASMPNLRKLMSIGTSYEGAWVGGVVNNTPPGHSTITTGCFTRTHGIVAFNWKDPVTGDDFNPTKLKPVQKGDLARIFSNAKAPSIGRLLKETDPSAKIAAVGAHKFYAVASLAADSSDCTLFLGGQRKNVELGLEGAPDDTGQGDFVQGQRPSKEVMRRARDLASRGDSWGMDAAIIVAEELKPRVLMINLPATDGTGHTCGGILSPDVMKPVVENVDREIGRLVDAYEKLGIYDQTVFIVTADHAMMLDEPPAKGAITDEAFRKAGVKVVCSTGAGPMWISDSSKAAEVTESIMAARPRGASAGYFKVKEGDSYVYRACPATEKSVDAKLGRTYEYLLSTVACANGPDIFLCSREPSSVPADLPKRGRHYQIAWGAQHVPLVISGPGVKQGLVSKSPARIVDIAPTVLTLLGAQPKGMDGIALADALTNPSKAAMKQQRKANKKLTPLRDALRDQPKYDPAAVN